MEIFVGAAGMLALAWAWHADVHWFEHHWLVSYCVRGSKTLRAILAARIAAAACGLFLLLFMRPRLGRWIAKRPLRDAVATFARIGIPVFFALVVCEIVLRIKYGAPNPYPNITWLPKARANDAYIWELEPSHTSKVNVGGRDLQYVVDAHGFRLPEDGTALDLEKPTVVFAGESLVFGLGVSNDETYAAMLAAELGITAVNSGVHGYGSDQVYLRTKDILPSVPHLAALVTAFLPSQLERNIFDFRKRLALRSDGTLEAVEPTPAWLREIRMRLLWRELVPYHGDESIALTRALLRATAELARARGAVALFLVTNCEAPCIAIGDDTPRIVREIFDAEHLSYVKVDMDPTWHVPYDVHPDVRGHRKIAAALGEALRQAKIGH
jgi:hypothetical protein